MANAIRQIPGLQEALNSISPDSSRTTIRGKLEVLTLPASISLDYEPIDNTVLIFVNGVKLEAQDDYLVYPSYKRIDILNRLTSDSYLTLEWYYETTI
jgi:hypothetical protein